MVDTLSIDLWQQITRPMVRLNDPARRIVNCQRFDHAAVTLQEGSGGTIQTFTIAPIRYVPVTIPAVTTRANIVNILGPVSQSFIITNIESAGGAVAALTALRTWFPTVAMVMVGTPPVGIMLPNNLATFAPDLNSSILMATYAASYFRRGVPTPATSTLDSRKGNSAQARSGVATAVSGAMLVPYATSLNGVTAVDKQVWIKSRKSVSSTFNARRIAPLVQWLNNGYDNSSNIAVTQP